MATMRFVSLGYAGLMLWLGWRLLARFQATGGMASDDLLMAGPDVMPGAWAGWLRCRPTGAVLNLIRKELRLLRPVWLISLLAALGWACLTLFGLLYRARIFQEFRNRGGHCGCGQYVDDRDSRRKYVVGGRKNVGDARLAHDLAGVGLPPVAHQAVHGPVRGFRWRGAAPDVDRGRFIWIVPRLLWMCIWEQVGCSWC